MGVRQDTNGLAPFGDVPAFDVVSALGLDWSTDQLLLSSGANNAADAVPKPEFGRVAPPSLGFGEAIDPFNPREVGWVVVVGADDPDKGRLVNAIKPLATRRGGPGSWGPIEMAPAAEAVQWVFEYIDSRDPIPRYVLLLGSPRHLPFELHSYLARNHQVGRLDFSSIADDGTERQDLDALASYVGKVVRLEDAAPRVSQLPVVMWAPSRGPTDPTFYSRRVLVEPLAARLVADKKVPTEVLVGQRATKAELLEVVVERQPAVLFTASHGRAVAVTMGLALQARHNGSLVDQHLANLTVDDLPSADLPFVEGGLIYSFACFGYGTPSTSGYTHWSAKVREYEADVAFVAALPKRYLAHPRGPIAFVGHADYALLHAFTDPHQPARPHNALSPHLAKYREALDLAMLDQPYSTVLSPLAGHLSQVESELVQVWDDAKKVGAEPGLGIDLVDTFLRRNDARASFLLGDPAARPRLR